jgi:hypothetical protein
VEILAPQYLLGPLTVTARFHLDDFDFALQNVRGVRFEFDGSPSGEITVDDILFSRYGSGLLGYFPVAGDLLPGPNPGAPPGPPPVYAGMHTDVGMGTGYDLDGSSTAVHEIEVATIVPVDWNTKDPVLVIGADKFLASRKCGYPGPLNDCLIFQILPDAYENLEPEAEVSLTFDRSNAPVWLLGNWSP